MSDIFISYKREEQPVARKLADALEREGWTVWWDPKLRVGEHFDDVIEKALNESKCVIVLWSERSVQSRYVRDEATYALDRDKLVPVAIENVSLPFRFRGVHTLSLLGWDGSKDFSAFRRLVDDISTILGPSLTAPGAAEEQRRLEAEKRRKLDEQRLREQEEAKRKAEEANRRRIDQEVPNPWRTYGPVVAAVALVLVIFSFVFWWPKRQETERVEKQQPLKETVVPTPEAKANGQRDTAKQPPVVKRQPEKQIAEPRQERVEAPTGLPSQAQAERKQEKPIVTQPVLSAGKVFRDSLKNGVQGPEMVVIPAGSFRMGDVQGGGKQDELPVRTVKIQKPFAIGRYEVTFDEYDQFAKAVLYHQFPGDNGWGRGRRPVIQVSWEDAVEYAKWLSEQTGNRYRLPTEAEWEYAARAGTETLYWWGNEMNSGMANCIGCGSQWDAKQTTPVGSFKPNPFGLYDTAGNVWEWLQDCWHDNYNGAPTNGSAWKEAGGGICAQRVLRGGSWDLRPVYSRASSRYRTADVRTNYIGFRLAQDIN